MAEQQDRHPNDHKRWNPPGVDRPANFDKDLADEVKDRLLTHTESAGIDIHVGAEDGVVRLFGVVDVLSHKTAAEELARTVPGVKRIENDITVADEEHVKDRHLLQEITERLQHRKDLQNMGVRVHKGVVRLVGHGRTYDHVDEAVKMIQDVAGVRDVRVDRVKVGEGIKEDDADVSRQAEHLLEQLGYNHQLFEVWCNDGDLYVRGFVPTREDRSRIKTEMHKLRGVNKLDALLITDEQMADDDTVH